MTPSATPEGPYEAVYYPSEIVPYHEGTTHMRQEFWRTVGPMCHSVMVDKTTAEYWRDKCNEAFAQGVAQERAKFKTWLIANQKFTVEEANIALAELESQEGSQK